MRQADLLSFLGSAQLARWPPWWWHGHGLNCGARHSGHGRVRSQSPTPERMLRGGYSSADEDEPLQPKPTTTAISGVRQMLHERLEVRLEKRKLVEQQAEVRQKPR